MALKQASSASNEKVTMNSPRIRSGDDRCPSPESPGPEDGVLAPGHSREVPPDSRSMFEHFKLFMELQLEINDKIDHLTRVTAANDGKTGSQTGPAVHDKESDEMSPWRQKLAGAQLSEH